MPEEENAEVPPSGRKSEQEKKSDSDDALQNDEANGGLSPYFVSR